MSATWCRVTSAASLAFCLIASSCFGQTSLPEKGLSIGINVNRISDYNPSWVFTDALKQSRPWISFAYNPATKEEKWNAGGPIELDELGMPKSLRRWTDENGQPMQQRVGTLIFREIGDAYPSGLYQAQWQGDGRVEFGLSARIVKEGIGANGVHWANVDVRARDAGILLKITETNPKDPIRDLHLWMPDHGDVELARKPWKPGAKFSPFHPLFKERLAPFSTLRFVDWTATNWTTAHTWKERTTYKHVRQSGDKNGKGAALELAIALANETGKDVWINTPPWADDNYVRNMARLFRDTLNPDQKIYVEWANELWNFAPGFATHPWLKDQANLASNQGRSVWQIAATNAKRDLQIWTEEFADQPERLCRVVAGQSANPWIAKELIKNVGVKNIDAVACSAYVQLTAEQRQAFNAKTTASEIVAAGMQNLTRVRNELSAHKRLVDMCSKIARRPIKLVCYEGGQHFDARGRQVPYLDALFAAQSHADMEKLYDELLKITDDVGVQLMNHYAYVGRNSAHGSWGALSEQDQPLETAPKYRALVK